ncbi:hypothetical protein OH77DRAFT_1410608 [Trametes cingulata]|nr:hypothetical protein OH77DRAFT_1410608 [Trametes cingulata]
MSAIATYREWKGLAYVPPEVHPALHWTADPAYFALKAHSVSWHIVVDPKKKKNRRKRKAPISDPAPLPKRKRQNEVLHFVPAGTVSQQLRPAALGASNASPSSPYADSITHAVSSLPGLPWDSVDYSCAYDAVLTVLLNVQLHSGPSDMWAGDAPLARQLSSDFAAAQNDSAKVINVRNSLRDILSARDPVMFRRHGPMTTAVSDVLEQIFLSDTPFGQSESVCFQCRAAGRRTSPHVFPSPLFCLYPALLQTIPRVGTHFTPCSVGDALRYIMRSGSERLGRSCDCNASEVQLQVPTSSCTLVVELQPGTNISIDRELRFQHTDTTQDSIWMLCGVVYLGSNHFTARYISDSGMAWYHDGASTGSLCTPEGPSSAISLASAFGRAASHLLYFKRNVL